MHLSWMGSPLASRAPGMRDPAEITAQPGAPDDCRQADRVRVEFGDRPVRKRARLPFSRVRLGRRRFEAGMLDIGVDLALGRRPALIAEPDVLSEIVGEVQPAAGDAVEPPEQRDACGGQRPQGDGAKRSQRRPADDPAVGIDELVSRHVVEAGALEPDRDVVAAVAAGQLPRGAGSQKRRPPGSRQARRLSVRPTRRCRRQARRRAEAPPDCGSRRRRSAPGQSALRRLRPAGVGGSGHRSRRRRRGRGALRPASRDRRGRRSPTSARSPASRSGPEGGCGQRSPRAGRRRRRGSWRPRGPTRRSGRRASPCRGSACSCGTTPSAGGARSRLSHRVRARGGRGRAAEGRS